MAWQQIVYDFSDKYGMGFLFLLAIPEGNIMSIMSGYFVRLGHTTVPIAVGAMRLANIIGDVFLNWLGSKGNPKGLVSIRNRVGLNDQKLAQYRHKFQHSCGRLILFGKATQVPSGAILFAAGMLHYSFGKFLFYMLIGNFFFVTFYTYLGCALVEGVSRIDNDVIKIAILVDGIALVDYLVWRMWKQYVGSRA